MALSVHPEEALFEELLDPLALFTPARDEGGNIMDFRLSYANRAACDEAWCAPADLADLSLAEAVPEVLDVDLVEACIQAMDGEPFRRDAALVSGTFGGPPSDRILALRAFRVGERLAVTWRDVTALRRSAQVVAELTRVRRVLASTGRAMIRLRKREPLLDEICRIAVEEGSLRMAWAGLVDASTGRVRPVASRGFVQGYLDDLEVSVRNEPSGKGPTGSAIRSGRPIVCNDLARDPRFAPWRDRALERGYRSSASLPLRSEMRTIGALSLYSAEPDAFGREELEMLEAMAEDLSFALSALESEEARRQAERALQASDARVRAMNEELEERVRERTAELEAFTHSVSHDLRSPLQGIMGYVELLAADYADVLEPDAVRMLSNIDRAAGQMCDLMEDLLLFSRVGRTPLEVEAVDLTVVAREVALEVRSQEAPERDLDIQIGDLGKVKADPYLVRHVLVNLLRNAAKFTRRQAAAKVEVFRKGDQIHVRDNGVGFDVAEAHRLFQPFVRLDPSFPGTGLGLAIVRRIVSRLGGATGAESHPGDGATFWFSLP